jgi:hypothetical protein
VYEVEGAAKALRSMWPLVFSKQDAVRQTVLESWHVLHLHDKTAKEQVRQLMQGTTTCRQGNTQHSLPH